MGNGERGVRPAKKTDEELLVWAASIIRREQERGTFGQIVIQMEAGRIVRARTETSERPDDD